MFGKKDDKKQTLPNIKIDKIPDDFYAGTNPVVKFKAVEKQVDLAPKSPVVLTSVEKKNFEKQTVVGSGNRLHPINLLANWKFLVLISVSFLILGGVSLGGYYYWQYKKTVKVATVIPPPKINIPVNNPVNQNPPTPTPTVEVVVPPPVVVNPELRIDFPSSLLAESVDTDKDGISDVAEEIFKTDPTIADTDKDGYTDGHEVYYLYNPSGKEPLKLLDSGLIKIFKNPVFAYQLYYPVSWAVGNVDSSYKDVLFSTLSGENVEVRIMDKDKNQNFNDWFGINAPNERLSDYSSFSSVFKEDGWARNDGLVYFFPKDDKMVAVIYHTTDSSIVNYKIVAVMMARSFQFGQASAIPDRVVENNMSNPTVSSSSTTSTILSATSTLVTSTVQ